MTFKNVNDKWYLDYSDNIKHCNKIVNLINSFYKKIPTTQHQILNYMSSNLTKGFIELSTLDNLIGIMNIYFFKNATLTEYNMQNIILFLSKSYTKIKDVSNVSILYTFLNDKYFIYLRMLFSDLRILKDVWNQIQLNNYNNLRISLSLAAIIPSPIKTYDSPIQQGFIPSDENGEINVDEWIEKEEE